MRFNISINYNQAFKDKYQDYLLLSYIKDLILEGQKLKVYYSILILH